MGFRCEPIQPLLMLNLRTAMRDTNKQFVKPQEPKIISGILKERTGRGKVAYQREWT